MEELEGSMLNEISQIKNKIPYDVAYIWNLNNETNEQTKQK